LIRADGSGEAPYSGNDSPRARAIIFLGGYIAEVHAYPHMVFDFAHDIRYGADVITVREQTQQLALDEFVDRVLDRRPADLWALERRENKRLRRITVGLIEAYWPNICRVAAALEERGRVSGREVAELVR
jgi:hypothetical protein